ncbi:MAG: T9SS type A sorting domain-containing protein, partial [Rhodothermales bacterium]
NVEVTENTFVPGAPRADFTITRLDNTQTGTYGLIAASACNATVIDPDLDYSGTGARGDIGMASTEVGSGSMLDALTREGDAASRGAEATLPGTFAVGQNYPNPFRASTSIAVELPESTELLLEVYNLLGQRIAVVANDLYGAGSHTFSFEARDLPSGTYIYRIVTPELSVARRMVVLN